MSDETKLSRRGFLGMLAAMVGAVLSVVGGDGVVRVAGLDVEGPAPSQPAGGVYRVKIDGTGTPDTFTFCSLVSSAQ